MAIFVDIEQTTGLKMLRMMMLIGYSASAEATTLGINCTVLGVLQSIYTFIVEQDQDNAVNQDIAEVYKINRDLYHVNAIEWKQFCNRFK